MVGLNKSAACSSCARLRSQNVWHRSMTMMTASKGNDVVYLFAQNDCASQAVSAF